MSKGKCFNYFDYCYVFCYNTCSIYQIILDERDEELSTEDILKRRGLNEDECSVMFSRYPQEIEDINVIDNEYISD